MKRWLIIGSCILILALVAVIFLFSSMDTLITNAIIKIGSEITQTKVSLDKTEISPTSGKGALHGLKIGNPENYASESAFELNEISLTFDVATLADPTIIIKEIVIAAPEVTYERGPGTSNFDVIQENIDSYMNKRDKSSSGSKKETSDTKSEVKLIVEKLYIRDGKVKVIAPQLKDKPMIIKLATLELVDIGKEKGGGSPAELVQEVLGAVRQSVVKSLMVVNLGDGQEILRGTTAEIKEQIEGGVGGTSESLEKKGERLGESLGNFFQKDSKTTEPQE